VGIEIDTTIDIGESFSISVSVGGTNNSYQWYKDDIPLAEAISNTYQIGSAAISDSGTYICRVTNSVVPDLTISSQPIHLVIIDPTGLSESVQAIPKHFALNQNYPNPFNPSTIIDYELPITQKVELSIYNLLGQKVATLVSDKQDAGFYQVVWDGTGQASGIYYYRIQIGNFHDIKKMILLR
jgi:hypothetical protein